VRNNPINYLDPSGEFELTSLLIAAGIGALIGGIGGAVSYAMSHPGTSFEDLINSGCFWRSVGIGAAAGAVAGAVGWATPALLSLIGISANAGLASAVIAGAVTGSLASGAGQATSNILAGESWSSGLGKSMLVGLVSGGIAGGVGNKLRQILSQNRSPSLPAALEAGDAIYDVCLEARPETGSPAWADSGGKP